MLNLIVASLLVVFVGAVNVKLNSEWESFKITYNKQYGDLATETFRRNIWEDHLRFIEKHNAEAARGEHTYTVGMNEFGDMAHHEFVSMMNGLRLNLHKKTKAPKTFHAPASLTALPATVDWRTKGYVTAVKNQRQCGSCWAFSATGSLEGQHFNKTGKLVSLSEQNLVDCSKKEGNHGCEGGLMDYAFQYIKKNNGIDTEDSYPYKARDEKCHFKAADVGATLTSYVDVQKGSESALQAASATVGPISVGIDASHISFQMYKSGVYNERQCSTKRLDHGVLVVGYGTEGGKDYWLVKNSWGESWGMKGYIMMSRNDKNQCGIATQASYPVV